MPSKYLTDETFQAQIQLLREGKTTRKQICLDLGIVAPELSRRIKSCGLTEELKGTRNYTGEHLFKADPDNAKAYGDAIAYALAHPTTPVKAVHRKAEFSGLNYVMLARRVKKALEGAEMAKKREIARISEEKRQDMVGFHANSHESAHK